MHHDSLGLVGKSMNRDPFDIADDSRKKEKKGGITRIISIWENAYPFPQRFHTDTAVELTVVRTLWL